MSGHLCQESDVTREKLRQLVAGRNRQMDPYKCGCCLKTFETICVLHLHCMKHNEGGSYYFDHVTNTAFPKYDSKCSYAQVNLANKDDYESYERILTAFARSINGKRKINQIREVEDNNFDQEKDDKILVAEQIDCAENTAVTALTAVNVRNIARSADGITFEMDERHAHLFNATASVIMDQINTSGKGWLQQASELQVMVPNDGDKRIKKTPSSNAGYINASVPVASTGSVKESEVSAILNTVKDLASQELFETKSEESENSTKTQITEDIHTSTKGSVKNHTTEVGEPDCLLPVTTISSKDEIVVSGNKETIKEAAIAENVSENIGKEVRANLCNVGSPQDKEVVSSMNVRARPVRHRKPSSRLNASEWETPGRRKCSERESNSHRDKSVKHSIIELKVADSSFVNVGGFQNEVKPDGTQFSQLSTDITTSDDISASRVLLSLSKGLRKKTKSTDDEEKTVIRKKRKRKSNTDTSNAKLDSTNLKHENTEVKDSAIKIKSNTDADDNKEQDNKTKNVANKNGSGEFEKNHTTDTENMKVKRMSKRLSTRNADAMINMDENHYQDIGQLSERETELVSGEKLEERRRRDYVCGTCGKTGTKKMIDYHRLAHGTEASFMCDVCGKGFKTRQCLSAHKRLHGERKYKCDQCSAAFFRKQYLETHKLKHTGEIPFVCDHCGARFMQSYILQRHIKNKHHQERNHTCDVCGMTFFRPDTRDTHRERHFEATLKCAYCDKLFKAELDRRKHELTHTGEKQVFCPKCKCGFSQVWSYYRHMWKKHNVTKEEAKMIKIKNPDLVYMRNKLLDYKAENKKERTNKEPIYSVNKRVTKHAESTKIEPKKQGLKYKVELPVIEESQATLDGERERTVEEEKEGTHFDLLAGGGGQLAHQSEFGDAEREMYGELVTPQQLFVNSSSLPDGMVLQDGQAMEGRGSLVLGEGHSGEGTNISIVLDDGQTTGQRNLVILSADIEAYAKQYSAADI